MADITIAADQQGAYEVPLQAGTSQTFRVNQGLSRLPGTVTVLVHSGAKPVYARLGSTITSADPAAVMIPPSTWSDLAHAEGSITTVSVISAADAIVSVYR